VNKVLNYLLFFSTLAAGIAGWAIGEACIINNDTINDIPTVGLYILLLSFLMITGCILSEKIVPSMVSKYFYTKVTIPDLKISVPVVFAALFLLAGVLQFIYGLTIDVNTKPAVKQTTGPVVIQQQVKQGYDDYYYVIDNSSSMLTTDPDNKRIAFLSNIVDGLPEQRQIALISFGEIFETLLPLQNATARAKKKFKSFVEHPHILPSTDIIGALYYTSGLLSPDTSRKGVVIFISDGESYEDGFDAAVKPFIDRNMPIYTIMLIAPVSGHDPSRGIALLQKIATATGGKQTTIDNFEDFEQTVVQSMNDPSISTQTSTVKTQKTEIKVKEVRNLLKKRVGHLEDSVLYMILHILFITIIGAFMGLVIAFIFGNRDLIHRMLAGGIVSGVLAGLVLEFFLQNDVFTDYIVRLIASIILTVVLWTTAFILYGLIARNQQSRLKGQGTKPHNTNNESLDNSVKSSKADDINMGKVVSNGVEKPNEEKPEDAGREKFQP
jgi:Ca-activated chloride channel family protein